MTCDFFISGSIGPLDPCKKVYIVPQGCSFSILSS
jgi:hypothetical protein